MATEQHQNELVNANSAQGMIALTGAETEKLPLLPPTPEPDTQGRRWSRKIIRFLDQLPDYLGGFFAKYQSSLLTLALILSAIITVKLVVALLNAINTIPLLSPTFELIGMGYLTWFSLRYLIQASTRQELADKIKIFKQEFLGEQVS